MKKTNAMRMLEEAGIDYEVLEYQIDKDAFSGQAVSDLLGLDQRACYKTLGLRHGSDVYLCVISTADEIDFKKAAKALQVKDLEMIHVRDLLKLVGYERGSVSPVGAKRNKGILFDDEVLNYETIEISGGILGIGLKLRRADLLSYLNANVADIIRS